MANKKEKIKFGIMLGFAGVCLIFFLIILHSYNLEDKKTKEIQKIANEQAKVENKRKNISINCAESEVKNQLKAPSTSKFQSFYSDEVYKSNKYYIIQSYVDSQNSFGAMLRQNFICKVLNPNIATYLCESVECYFE